MNAKKNIFATQSFKRFARKQLKAKGWEKEMNIDLIAQLRHWMISLTHCFYVTL